MNWDDKLKKAEVSIHIIATGAGAGLQKLLWSVPGSSVYLSGASFPYATEETKEILGFTPESFCSEDTAIDLASAAYMKAFKFTGKNPVGIGLTASVASEKEHRGEHRIHICMMANDQVMSYNHILDKGVGFNKRASDGFLADHLAFTMLMDLSVNKNDTVPIYSLYNDVTEKALSRFFKRPFFTADGSRYNGLDDLTKFALMPGAYNPPHEGHYGMADVVERYGKKVVFNTTTNPPHKTELSVQDCLKRAKLLNGKNRLFTRDDPFYIDKARKYPGMPILIGTDALQRIFDPKWGLDVEATLKEFKSLGTLFYISSRVINGKFVSGKEVIDSIPEHLYTNYSSLFIECPGRWDISSSEIRDKINK